MTGRCYGGESPASVVEWRSEVNCLPYLVLLPPWGGYVRQRGVPGTARGRLPRPHHRPKPRLRWTTELHERFVDAVNQLGGPDKATPKTIMRTMAVKGLTLYHLKSHLQKYRLGTKSKEVSDSPKDESVSCFTTELWTMHLQRPVGCNEAMRVQMELQRRLHEHLEVQHHLQLRIEAQGRYLNSILEKACNALTEPAISGIHLEGTRQNLSELAIADPEERPSFPHEPLNCGSWSEIALQTLKNRSATRTIRPTECSIDSCLTSVESPRRAAILAAQASTRGRSRPLFGNCKPGMKNL
ncbi:unnamed protein product [Spirodela intermedia]|uniref:HTH myb-type domain-containing protein n=1 Tax=Spirodela intermedia TaxID=51605 RepID=A0A7I8JCV5_SPIIN|nr:unnamed protein product [Spirodela intermedia]CAA6667970.1 unnamed protein product [Spirodela intermedia]